MNRVASSLFGSSTASALAPRAKSASTISISITSQTQTQTQGQGGVSAATQQSTKSCYHAGGARDANAGEDAQCHVLQQISFLHSRAYCPVTAPSSYLRVPSSEFDLVSQSTTFAARGLASGKKAKGKKKQKGDREKEEEKVATAADDESGEEELLDLLDPTNLEGYREDCLESLKIDYASIRPNRATPGMLDHILVPAYEGEKMPLKHLATSHARDVSTLVVSLYDPQTLQAVEKAILQSPLELSPFVEGEEIIVRVPTPTEESKQQLCKIARSQVSPTKGHNQFHPLFSEYQERWQSYQYHISLSLSLSLCVCVCVNVCVNVCVSGMFRISHNILSVFDVACLLGLLSRRRIRRFV